MSATSQAPGCAPATLSFHPTLPIEEISAATAAVREAVSYLAIPARPTAASAQQQRTGQPFDGRSKEKRNIFKTLTVPQRRPLY